MAFSTVFNFLYSTPANFYHDLSLHDLVELGNHEKNFRVNVLNAQFIRDYCSKRKIPHLEVPDCFINKKELTDGDADAAGLYYLETLDSINKLCMALEKKVQIKNYSATTEEGKKARTVLNNLYHLYLNDSKGKGNFFAWYLYLYEHLSTDLNDADPQQCVEVFRKVERDDLIWFDRFKTAAELYKAELYHCFVVTLSNKVTVPHNKPANNQDFYPIIAEYILKAMAALNNFASQKKDIPSLTWSNMVYFTINISGTNPDNTLSNLRSHLVDIQSKNNHLIMPTIHLSDIMGRLIARDVDPVRLPWPIPAPPTQQQTPPPKLASIPPKASDQGHIKISEQPTAPAAQAPDAASSSAANRGSLHNELINQAKKLKPVKRGEEPIPTSDNVQGASRAQIRDVIQKLFTEKMGIEPMKSKKDEAQPSEPPTQKPAPPLPPKRTDLPPVPPKRTDLPPVPPKRIPPPPPWNASVRTNRT